MLPLIAQNAATHPGLSSVARQKLKNFRMLFVHTSKTLKLEMSPAGSDGHHRTVSRFDYATVSDMWPNLQFSFRFTKSFIL